MFEEDDDKVDPHKLPIFKKGQEIWNLVREITDLIQKRMSTCNRLSLLY
jgi:hypothetical protein